MTQGDRDLIERLRGLLAKATPGPWSYRSREFDDWGIVRAAEDAAGHMPIICQARDPYCLDGDDLAIHRANKTDPWEGNARLIAEAVTELPGLLDRIQALSAEVDRYRGALATCDDAIREYFRYFHGGEMRGSYDGKPERAQLQKAGHAAAQALKGANNG